MRTVEIYVAEDGTRFEDYDECVEYEAKRYSTGGVKYYDDDLDELTPENVGWEELGNAVKYVCVLDAEKAEKEFGYLLSMYGFEFPGIPESRVAYAYNGRKAEWYKITDKIEKYTRLNEQLWYNAMRE